MHYAARYDIGQHECPAQDLKQGRYAVTNSLFMRIRSRFPSDLSKVLIETAEGTTYSYGDADAASARIAGLLTALGAKKGDRVAVQVDKSPEALFLYLGCIRAGLVYLPLNTAYQAGELAYFMGNAAPIIFVCQPHREDEVTAIADAQGVEKVLTLGTSGEGTLIHQAADFPAEFTPVACADDELAAILYTSGTTGKPKGAMMTQTNLWSNAATLEKLWGFGPDDVLLHALPIFHTHGLFIACHCVMLSGSKMFFLPKFDRDQVMALLPRSTVMMGVPTFYVRLLSGDDFNADVTSGMRLFISGSAPLLPETFVAFRERTGKALLERYGMTEMGMATSNPLNGERIVHTVGPALPDVEVRVCDDKGNVLGTDEIGVLEARGPNVFAGYWQMPEKTAEEFREDGFFITGDIAKIDAKGYVHIVGRAKDLVISGGFNVYPKEIETVIDKMDGVVESAVIGVAHPDFGEAVVAVIVRSSDKLSEDDVVNAIKGQLANFKVPKRVFFVSELPRNAMGKVQKNILREDYSAVFAN
ncbi:malonyl-CoA synthase [Thalassospira permensis NBRC 106175]|uniref:Malonyl-CoA synthase n=1 Tax=Thalassospira permensis NBRC 106175 TaxID=1353532 RepID=A0ABR4TK80_9PROT|nr:malonyl-CoA synthase [Thalassospira permensis]KEO53558.1 malonyl-CoA synthase [Thalassospira permensis NBRC 106175]